MSTTNIKYGKNYHIKRIEHGYRIEFNDKDRTYRQDVIDDSVSEAKQVEKFDERVMLSDQKYLIRIRDEIYIK